MYMPLTLPKSRKLGGLSQVSAIEMTEGILPSVSTRTGSELDCTQSLEDLHYVSPLRAAGIHVQLPSYAKPEKAHAGLASLAPQAASRRPRLVSPPLIRQSESALAASIRRIVLEARSITQPSDEVPAVRKCIEALDTAGIDIQAIVTGRVTSTAIRSDLDWTAVRRSILCETPVPRPMSTDAGTRTGASTGTNITMMGMASSMMPSLLSVACARRMPALVRLMLRVTGDLRDTSLVDSESALEDIRVAAMTNGDNTANAGVDSSSYPSEARDDVALILA